MFGQRLLLTLRLYLVSLCLGKRLVSVGAASLKNSPICFLLSLTFSLPVHTVSSFKGPIQKVLKFLLSAFSFPLHLVYQYIRYLLSKGLSRKF